jgi:Inner membrane protein YgaP-like, transmembrane domain
MKHNMGTADRGVRAMLAALGWLLAWTIGYASVAGVIVLVVAGILVATAVVGMCPLYAALGISTDRGHRSIHV